jgi:hypothetical protein
MVASTPEKDASMEEELVAMGKYAVPALVRGLKYPPGFADKRAALCRILGRIGDQRAAPGSRRRCAIRSCRSPRGPRGRSKGLADPATRPALVR